MTHSSAIELIVISDFARLLKEKEKWNDLLKSSDADYVYLTLEWLDVYWQTFKEDSIFFCLIAVDSNDRKWVGALPMSIRKTDLTDLRTKIMSQMGGELADYLSPIIRRGWERKVVPLFFDRVAGLASDDMLVTLKNVPQQHSLHGMIEGELLKRGWTYHKAADCCPVLFMEGLGYDDVQKKWKKNHRADVRRQIRRLSKKGRLDLKFFSTPEEIEANFKQFMPMCEKRWKSIGYPDPMIKNRGREYYSNLINKLSDSFLHFSALCLDERPISYHIGFLYNNWFYYYKPTHDIEYERYSPGKVHVAYLIEHGCSEKWLAFDFLRGDEQYKFNWTSDTLKLTSFTISTTGAGFRYKWHTGGKTKAYELVGGFYRKLRLARQGTSNMISK